MQLTQYVKDAIVTESRLSGAISVDIHRFLTVIKAFVAAGNLLDVMKKDIFYGVPTDPVKAATRKQRIIDNEALLEAAAIQITISPNGEEQLLTAVDSRLAHAIIGISTESVELLEALLEACQSGKPIDTVNVLEELGDVNWYLAIAVSTLGADWEQILTTNIAKLKERYKAKFDAAEALERDLIAERAILEEGSVGQYFGARPPDPSYIGMTAEQLKEALAKR